MKSTRSHSNLVLVFLVFNPGDLYYHVFLSKLGRKLADQSGDFLFQRFSVPIQRYNAIGLLHDCFVKEEE